MVPPLNVLIADEDKMFAQLLAGAIAPFGYQVSQPAHSVDVLTKSLSTNRTDLLILGERLDGRITLDLPSWG